MNKTRWQPLWLGLVLIVLLGLMLTKSFSINQEEHQRYQNLFLQQVVHYENLNKNILRAKYQVWSSYDAINRSWRSFNIDFQKARHIPDYIRHSGQKQIQEAIEKQEQELAQLEEDLERFKTNNAILKTSVSYLPELTSKVIAQVSGEGNLLKSDLKSDVSRELTKLLDRLLEKVLLYNLTSDRSIALDITFTLNQLSRLNQKSDGVSFRSSIEVIKQHAQLILDRESEVKILMDRLLDSKVLKNTEAIQKLYLDYYTDAVKLASFYRFLLYTVSILSLAWISYLIIDRLRDNNLKISRMNVHLEETLHQLKTTQAQLIHTEKMSSLGQVVAGVAHEINNPVSFIYSNIQPAREYIDDLLELMTAYQTEYPDPPPQIQDLYEEREISLIPKDLHKILDSMQTGADRIRRIVLSLRNFSRLDESEMKTVDVHEGIESTLALLQNRLNSNTDQSSILVTKNYSQLPKLTCYPSQLNQVLLNLLNNAIDAFGSQSFPDIDANIEELKLVKFEKKMKQITITTELRQSDLHDRAILRIRDNGCGIPETIQPRIFDPFFTTKPVGQGTGLGLSISYQIIVEKHQGRLTCNSKPNEGTEFCIELPIR